MRIYKVVAQIGNSMGYYDYGGEGRLHFREEAYGGWSGLHGEAKRIILHGWSFNASPYGLLPKETRVRVEGGIAGKESVHC